MEKKGHLTPQDVAYLHERIKVERQNAQKAADPKVAQIHREMAIHYECVLELGTSSRPRAGAQGR